MKSITRKIISIVLIVMMVFSGTMTAFADSAAGGGEEQEKQEEQLKAEQEAEEKAAAEKAAAEKAKQEAEEKAAQEKQEAEAKAAAEKAKQEAAEKAAEEKAQEKEAEEPEAPAWDEQQEEPAQSEKPEEQAEAAQEESSAKSSMKLSAELSDGTYKPEAVFTGGSGRVTYSCEKVIIKDGAATAVFQVDTENVTHIYMDKLSSRAENNSLYNPKTGATGEGVYTFVDRHVSIPVTINTENGVDFSGRTNAMSPKSRWIGYTYKLTIADETQKISDDTTIPENGTSKPEKTDDESEKEPSKKKKSKTLKDGTYKVKATTCRVMFYLYPKEKNPAKVILVKKNGKMTATITLTGTGYDYVYMGTPKQAKKAGKKKWIKYKKKNGFYTFKIPVAKLDKKLPITPHSSKYESDGDPSTDPWRPDKWIKFYRKGAKKVKAGSTIKTKGKASNRNAGSSSGSSKGKNDGKAESQSKWSDDSGKSTGAVDNSTGLKDGVYSPDRFSWSGGSGRLAYIRCNKITVKGGKAYATIEFSSSKYDSLKANGRIYSRSGGGNSTFTIPVKMNANNTIIGRTTAMSQPHWIKYTIFIYKKGAGASKGGKTAEGDDGHVTSTKKLSEKAPDLLGLEFKEKVEVKYAEYFRIYKYEQGITLIEVDQASDTALNKEEKKSKKDKKKEKSEGVTAEAEIEYDEDGKPIAKGQNEITEMLYHNNVVNYLIVPEKVEIPAGLEKDCIIINQPLKASYIASVPVLDHLAEMGLLDSVSDISMAEKDIKNKDVLAALKDEKLEALDDAEKPNYAALVKAEADFAVFPDAVLPEIVAKDDKDKKKAQAESDETAAKLGVMQSRFSALGVPMIVDRSGDEKTNYAEAEWVKVYGVIYGCEDKAEKIFDDFVKDNKKEKKAKDE